MWLHFTKFRFLAIFCFLWLISATVLLAQTTSTKPQLFLIHENPVSPTVVDEYEHLSKDHVSQSRKHGIQNGWLTIQDNGHRYYTTEPIGNKADLDKDPLASLQVKMGKEALATLFADFDKCCPSHCDFILVHLPQYSYAADQTSQLEPDLSYSVEPNYLHSSITLFI